MQIPKISLCPVCVSVGFSLSPFHPAACVLRDKPSTGFKVPASVIPKLRCIFWYISEKKLA